MFLLYGYNASSLHACCRAHHTLLHHTLVHTNAYPASPACFLSGQAGNFVPHRLKACLAAPIEYITLFRLCMHFSVTAASAVLAFCQAKLAAACAMRWLDWLPAPSLLSRSSAYECFVASHAASAVLAFCQVKLAACFMHAGIFPCLPLNQSSYMFGTVALPGTTSAYCMYSTSSCTVHVQSASTQPHLT